jgi:hypothetical protein
MASLSRLPPLAAYVGGRHSLEPRGLAYATRRSRNRSACSTHLGGEAVV